MILILFETWNIILVLPQVGRIRNAVKYRVGRMVI